MTIALDEAWIGVIGALGGVAITGLIGLVTAVLNHRWTRQSAEESRRNELLGKRAELRREAYARYLVAAQAVGEEIITWEPPDRSRPAHELLVAFRRARTELAVEYDASLRHARLVASEPVVRALVSYDEWMGDRLGDVALGWAARSNIPSLPDWDSVERPLIDAMRQEQGADQT